MQKAQVSAAACYVKYTLQSLFYLGKSHLCFGDQNKAFKNALLPLSEFKNCLCLVLKYFFAAKPKIDSWLLCMLRLKNCQVVLTL